jgi:hypothetical protein
MLARRFRSLFSMMLALSMAGVAMTSHAHAGFYKVIPPPSGKGGEKEIDPPNPPIVTPPTNQTPEPGTLALAVLGGATIAAWRRRKKA